MPDRHDEMFNAENRDSVGVVAAAKTIYDWRESAARATGANVDSLMLCFSQ